jgi:hypothetical protein
VEHAATGANDRPVIPPRRFGGVPLFPKSEVALFLFADQVQLGGGHFAVMDAEAVDLRQLREILLKLGREGHPVAIPLFGVFTRRGVGMGVTIVAQFGIALRRGPESIPSKLGLIKRDARFISCVQASEARADIDVSLIAQFAKLLFNPRVLREGLDKGPNRVERRHAHLLFELMVMARGKAASDPVFVVRETKVGRADEEVIGAESVEGIQPGFRARKVLPEDIDVR